MGVNEGYFYIWSGKVAVGVILYWVGADLGGFGSGLATFGSFILHVGAVSATVGSVFLHVGSVSATVGALLCS